MTSAEAPEGQLLYFADPMCSWCWGFSPVAAQLAERFRDVAPLSLVVGGLAAGETRAMDAATKAEVAEHWRHVEEATGQPFDHAFFDREGFVYDTEGPCRAVVVARGLDGGDGLPFLGRLHRAFYADNRDITSREVLEAVASEAGFDGPAFGRSWASEEAQEATARDFAMARQIGARAFPTVLVRYRAEVALLTQGWRPYAEIEPALARWLDAQAASAGVAS
jgi:putative protein-disulfide isomerase